MTSRIYGVSTTQPEKDNPIEIWTKGMNRHSAKEKSGTANKQMKDAEAHGGLKVKIRIDQKRLRNYVKGNWAE